MSKPTIKASSTGHLSTSNLEALLDKLNDLVFVVDTGWRLVYSNQKVYQVTGYTFEEIKGKPLTFFQKGMKKKSPQEIASKLLKNDTLTAELPFTSKSGSEKMLMVSIKKISWNGNKALLFVSNDITRFEIMRHKLRHFEAREEALLDNIPYQAWMKDANGVFITANKVFAQHAGIDKEQIKGKTDFEICSEEIAEKYVKQDREVMQKGEGKFVAKEDKNGKSFWYETIKTVIRNENGDVIGTTGITKDITEIKRSQILLEENFRQQQVLTNVAYLLSKPIEFEQKMNEVIEIAGSFLNASRVYIFENDNERHVTVNTYEWCNEGIEPQIDKLEPMPFDIVPNWWKLLEENDIIQSSNIKKLPSDLQNLLEPQGIKAILVYPIYVSEEQIGFIGFDECENNREWSRGEVEFLKTLAHMISNAFQQFRYEEALRKSERKFRELVELLPEMVTETDEKGYISFANELSFRKFKYDREEVDNRLVHIFDLFVDEDKPRAISALGKVNRGEEMKNEDFEYTAVTKKGDNFPVLVFVNPSIEDGEFQGLRGVMVDISDRKASEMRLVEAKRKAEEASKAKENFLATMSHEIRTPLNAIIGTVNLMKEESRDPAQEEAFDTLELSSRHLLNLINDILDFSKIEAGKVSLQKSTFNLESLLQSVLKLFQQKAHEKGLELTLNIDNTIPANIDGDGGRLMQIMNNLVSNAVKFTENGFVRIDARRVGKITNGKFKVRFSVEDSGIGISEDKHGMIFDSFSQVEADRTRKFEGTGLGLAITQKLVRLMNGKLKLKSKLGQGSKFMLTIPFEASDEEGKRKVSVAPVVEKEDLSNCKILLVEDNLINQKIAAKFLKKWNATVEVCENGKEALEELKNADFDLILMDIQMPVMDGYEATRRIRAMKNMKKSIPIIALTASALLEVQDEVLGAGMNDYITKPFNPRDLFDKINRLVKAESH